MIRPCRPCTTSQFDRCIVVTRDSDLAPAIRAVREDFPNEFVTVVAPPHRGHSAELIEAATDKAKITVEQLGACLLPDVVTDVAGDVVARRPLEYART